MAALLSLGLSGCFGFAAGTSEPVADQPVEVDPLGPTVDLSHGGHCEDGQDARVITDGSTPIITGDCGTVVIEGDRVEGNVESARHVRISGSTVTLVGTEWTRLTIHGGAVAVNVDRTGEATIHGDDVQVTAGENESVTIHGDSVTVNADVIDDLVVHGDANTVVSQSIERLDVHGDDNAFNWSDGATAAEDDHGTGNSYTR